MKQGNEYSIYGNPGSDVKPDNNSGATFDDFGFPEVKK